MKIFKNLILAVSLLITPISHAGFITLNEAFLDSIFSQSSFGNAPIDIRIGTATELVFPSLLDITTNAEITQLFGMHVGLPNIVNFYFVDTISACGGFINSGIVGCGELLGNDFVVESSYAAGGFGSELLAHELGHNLGLFHLNGNFLMNPFLNGHTTITANQVSTIHSSSLVKTDGQLFWIDINPVLIVAKASIPAPAPVPEPSMLVLFLIAFGLMYQNRIKRNS